MKLTIKMNTKNNSGSFRMISRRKNPFDEYIRELFTSKSAPLYLPKIKIILNGLKEHGVVQKLCNS